MIHGPVARGIQGGIEASVKVMMSVLAVLMIAPASAIERWGEGRITWQDTPHGRAVSFR